MLDLNFKTSRKLVIHPGDYLLDLLYYLGADSVTGQNQKHPKHFLQNVLRNPLGMLGVELVPHWLAIHSILHRRDELAVQTRDKCLV